MSRQETHDDIKCRFSRLVELGEKGIPYYNMGNVLRARGADLEHRGTFIYNPENIAKARLGDLVWREELYHADNDHLRKSLSLTSDPQERKQIKEEIRIIDGRILEIKNQMFDGI